jgi:hypothetical protein
MTGIAGDLREALRRMRTERRFTLTVVLTVRGAELTTIDPMTVMRSK